MSTLADAIALEVTKKGPRCETGLLVASLPADQRADLIAAFESDVTTAAIVRALGGLGYNVPTTLARHRKTARGETGGCHCPRTV